MHLMTFTKNLFCLQTASTTAVPPPPTLPHSGSGCHKPAVINHLNWPRTVKTNHHLQNCTPVTPGAACDDNVIGHYMQGGQYHKDCESVTEEAYKYAKGLELGPDGMDIWVFDIDETTISNVPFLARYGFRLRPLNMTNYNAWIAEAKAAAIPATLKLYRRLIRLGFKIVFLSAAEAIHAEARAKNLREVGYTTWEKLILRDESREDSLVFKSRKRKELEEGGYRIRGNMGDQWSDLLGTNPGERTFMLPNPMYHIP